MSVENAASNAGEVKQPVNPSAVTESEFLAIRIGQRGATAEKPNPKPEETAEEVPEEAEKSDGAQEHAEEEAETEEAKTESEQEGSQVLSKIDFDKLSEEEIQALANKARSKALSRFGELTSTIKELKGQIQQLQSSTHPKPSLEAAPQIPKEYAQIDKVEELQSKAAEAKNTMEWAEAQLDNAEHLGANDSLETEYGSFTKAKLKEIYRTARKAKDEWIPAQFNQLQERHKRATLREAYAQKAKQELPWLAGEENDVRKQYEALVKSPLVEKIKKAVPEAESDLEYVLGHAINSIHGRTYHSLTEETKPKKAASQVSITPPSQIKGAASSKGNEVVGKRLEALRKQFETTRSEKDLLALRTEQRKRAN